MRNVPAGKILLPRWPVRQVRHPGRSFLRKHWFFPAVLAGLWLTPARPAAGPFPGTVPGTEIGSFLSANFEPSGGAWHPRLNQLFVCGDNSTIARLSPDGGSASNWNLAGNWEGIAIADPASDVVFLVDENTAHIREFDFVTGTAGRDFDLTAATPAPGIPALTAADLAALVDNGDNRGLEALTFVPATGDPEGGIFWAGSQENGSIYQFRLSLSTGNGVTYLGQFKNWPADQTDLAGLEYDWAYGMVLAVWDGPGVLRSLTPAGGIVHEWLLPAGSNDEEGLGYDGNTLFIAEDPAPASEVWRYDNFQADPPLTGDVNGSGQADAVDLVVAASVLADSVVEGEAPCQYPHRADYNRNGALDPADLGTLAQRLSGR